MQRRGGSGQPVKGQSANRPKARNVPTAPVSTPDLQEQLDRRTRERDEALEQQTATSQILNVISSSPSDLQPVFQAILENATQLCEAKFGTMYLYENGAFRPAAVLNAPKALVEFIWQRGSFHAQPGTALERLMQTGAVAYTADKFAGGAAARFGGARSLMAVPMSKESKLIGAIIIYRQEVRPFADKQVELVKNFAAQAVIAIDKARLINQLRQRTDHLTESLEQQTATSEVLRVISSSPGELEPVFQAMLENARRICEAEFGALYRCEGGLLRTVAMQGAPQAFIEERRRNPLVRPPPQTALARAMATKQPVQIADIVNEPHYFDAPPGYSAVQLTKLSGARTVLTVPMLKENELIGAIVIYRTEVRPFSDKQIELVKNFAAQAVIAIENTRLLNELREALQQQTASLEVLEIISSSPRELEPVFKIILQNATRICTASFGNLYLHAEGQIYLVASHNVPPAFANTRRGRRQYPAESALSKVLRTKEPAGVTDLAATRPYIDREQWAVEAVELGGVRTAVCVPLLKEKQLVGIIAIYRQEVVPFTDKQVELLKNFAAQAVIAIDNARLLNDLNTLNQ